MRLSVSVILILSSFFNTHAQDSIQYKTHTYSEFVAMIQSEEDSIFKYSNAFIRFNPETDQRFKVYYKSPDSVFLPFKADSLIIDKHLELNNVHFVTAITDQDSLNGRRWSSVSGAFYLTSFKMNLSVESSISFRAINSTFSGKYIVIRNFEFDPPGKLGIIRWQDCAIQIDNCSITGDFNLHSHWNEEINESRIYFRNNSGRINNHTGSFAIDFRLSKIAHFAFTNNILENSAPTHIGVESARWVQLTDNVFNRHLDLLLQSFYDWRRLQLVNNEFKEFVMLQLPDIPEEGFVEWEQFEKSVISSGGYGPYVTELYAKNPQYLNENRWNPWFHKQYFDSIRIIHKDAFLGEMAFRGRLHGHFKSKYDTEQANAVFIDLKDLETKRLAYLYEQNPTFRTYFKLKINQFLKLFVDYGTEPAKAIVMAIYVILSFALIYLFFPNHWDSHGKERIKHRFLFFYKYLSLNKGIQDVYLEERKAEIENNEHFLGIMKTHKEEAPKFFYLAAIPLYHWSMSGTRLYSRLLKRVDFLKGKWKETDQKVRPLKSLLVVLMFLIAISYDLFIKVLNAVMLSINTFTTLGFGEIPIKGLPRYLAIIQGFIGWFMLTIFSVSLISQLLN